MQVEQKFLTRSASPKGGFMWTEADRIISVGGASRGDGSPELQLPKAFRPAVASIVAEAREAAAGARNIGFSKEAKRDGVFRWRQ